MALKKKGLGSEARAERLANADADLQLLGEAERARQLNKQKKRRRQGQEDDVCSTILFVLTFFLCFNIQSFILYLFIRICYLSALCIFIDGGVGYAEVKKIKLYHNRKRTCSFGVQLIEIIQHSYISRFSMDPLP